MKGINTEVLRRATSCLAHRGPDAEGTYTSPDGTVFLGHRRLSILDLSPDANQPMFSHCGRYVIIFNGEVYNFREIAADILQHSPGERFNTRSDTEVILASYKIWGPACVNRWNGMFAVAIYDQQQQELFIARDRFGVKPIVYYEHEGEFMFASELKSIRAVYGNLGLSMEALYNYLHFDYIPKPLTIYQHVYKFPNGHYAIINRDGIRFHSYYNILDKYSADKQSISDDDALEGFRALLKDSVRLRMVSDVPVGAFLSGGTDSSLVVANFQELSPKPINSFTIGFDVARYDESKHARKVAKLLQTNHYEYRVDEAYAQNNLDQVWKYYDEPFVGPSSLPSLIVCEKARQHVTVSLSGDGGDELFMGYNTYKWLPRLKRVERMSGSLGRNAVRLGLTLTNKTRRASRLFDYSEREKLFLHMMSEEQGMFNEREIRELIGVKDYGLVTSKTWQCIDRLDIADQEKISLFDINHYLADNLLYKMDIASMASSLEVRLPYLDYRLVEFSINLPTNMKIRNGEQKYLMKKALESYIPKEDIYRPKWGFPAPVGNWIMNSHSWLIDECLSPAYIKEQGIFNPAAVDKLVKRFRSGTFYDFKRVWSLIVFQKWYEHHFLMPAPMPA